MSQKVTAAEFAHAMYASSVYVDRWNEEQASLKFHWFETAEKMMADFGKYGYELVKIEKVEEPKKVETVEGPLSLYQEDESKPKHRGAK